MIYRCVCEVEVSASLKNWKVKIIFLITLINNGVVFPFCMTWCWWPCNKTTYRRIFGVEYDFCGVVAITSKTIKNNLNFFCYNCKIISAKILPMKICILTALLKSGLSRLTSPVKIVFAWNIVLASFFVTSISGSFQETSWNRGYRKGC